MLNDRELFENDRSPIHRLCCLQQVHEYNLALLFAEVIHLMIGLRVAGHFHADIKTLTKAQVCFRVINVLSSILMYQVLSLAGYFPK